MRGNCAAHMQGHVTTIFTCIVIELATAACPPVMHDTTVHLSRLVLQGPLFQRYFEKVEVSNFEVASDAFSTFKVSSIQLHQ